MPDSSPVDFSRQLRQHLECLRAAGVEYVPIAAPPSPASPESAGSEHIHGGLAAVTALFDGDRSDLASPARRRHELTVLAHNVTQCTRCSELASTRTQTVFGVGTIDPEICFVGEAPGADEDAQGEPFVGAAGQLLNRIIAACGLKREEVYICNILKCRPPGNRLPLPNEAACCREYLERQLELVHPRFICALGACAAQNLLNTTLSIGKLRGRFHDYRGIPVLCTYHPAYLLRSPDKKRDVWEDMKKLLQRLGRPVK
ncbi:MAG: uracil-DNA glycosylase [Planctomycetota bacterium]|nr:MAG: uracil-DNA glycosylase [Planctomycetota bacterium]